MTEREMLIDLLYLNCEYVSEQRLECLADYLLENGVIVLPCMVGDTVYQHGKGYTKCTPCGYIPKCQYDSLCAECPEECDSIPYICLYEGTVVNFRYDGKDIAVRVNWTRKSDTSYYLIGKDVFLTKEEAEQALNEGDKE